MLEDLAAHVDKRRVQIARAFMISLLIGVEKGFGAMPLLVVRRPVPHRENAVERISELFCECRLRGPDFEKLKLGFNAEFARPITPERAYQILRETEGVVVDEVPSPLKSAGTDPTYVGRIRTDYSVDDDRGLALFVVGDNLRKGAALNAVQIAEVVAAAILKERVGA